MARIAFDGNQAIAWIERFCRVPKGPYVGEPMQLFDYQKTILHGIFDTPTRRAIISMGRQNSKTTLSGCLMLLHLCGPLHQRNGLLVSSALTRDQAGILFTAAKQMIELNPELAAAVDVIEHQKTLRCRELGTTYRALSADAPTQLGLSPFFVVHDELGAVRGPFSELYNVLESGSAVQTRPLSIVISTQAADDDDLLSHLIDDAQSGSDPRVKLFLWTAPMDADPFVESTWALANPALGHFLQIEEVRSQAETARRMPDAESDFRHRILNQRVETEAPFVSPTVWEENGAQPTKLTKETRVVCGLDLGKVGDLSALEAVSLADGSVYSYGWLPEEGLAERSRLDDVDYVGMAKDGFLSLTPGRAIDYDTMAREMRLFFNTCTVVAVGFDRVFMNFLTPCLVRAGFTEEELARFVPVGQGFLGMGPCIRELETRLLGKKLKHGMHPLLRMAATNARVIIDDAGNKKFTKKKSTGRIDPIVALAMACAVIPPEQPAEPEYTVMFIDPPSKHPELDNFHGRKTKNGRLVS